MRYIPVIKKDTTFITWTEKTREAFMKCKELLADLIIMAYPSESSRIPGSVLASDVQLLMPTSQQPFSFFSRKLKPAKQTYSANNRQLLAAYYAVEYLQHYVEARTLRTDYKPLTFASRQKPKNTSASTFRPP